MSVSYKPIIWNKFKRQYDIILWSTLLGYLAIFIGITILKYPSQNIRTTLIRGFGTLGFLLLHIILLIGPLSRLSTKFLPILYNRRHLGVSMFIISLVHALLSLFHFHGNGNIHPITSLFFSNLHYNSLSYFPFQILGFFALLILAAMAFTSHDFWLHFLGPRFWKTMHMLVYVAYGLLLLHVALGIIQYETNPVFVILLISGFVLIVLLHLYTAFLEKNKEKGSAHLLSEDWVYACSIEEIQDTRAKVVYVGTERVALFKYQGKLSAVSNVCKHQLGPLGEGKIIDGCITCPWHGYQYKPEDGCAPAPFHEKIATYQLIVYNSLVFINKKPLPEGTYIEPTKVSSGETRNSKQLFFVGWSNNSPKLFSVSKRFAALVCVFIAFIAIAVSSSQNRLSNYVLNYETNQQVEGWLTERPFPSLKIIDGKDGYGNPVYKTILLTDAFKFGADSIVSKTLDGKSVQYVRITGYLNSSTISCGPANEDCKETCANCKLASVGFPIMEIENGRRSIEIIKEPLSYSETLIDMGEQTLEGEIIDPKCYFGAMNPGEGKAHLSCAIRCISGGIMPVLKFRVNNENRYAVLTGVSGEKINSFLLKYVGIPVKIKGHYLQSLNWGLLKLDPFTDVEFQQL